MGWGGTWETGEVMRSFRPCEAGVFRGFQQAGSDMTMFALQNSHCGYCAGKGWRRAVEGVSDQL